MDSESSTERGERPVLHPLFAPPSSMCQCLELRRTCQLLSGISFERLYLGVDLQQIVVWIVEIDGAVSSRLVRHRFGDLDAMLQQDLVALFNFIRFDAKANCTPGASCRGPLPS